MGSLAGSNLGSSHTNRMKSIWFSGYQDFINAGDSGRNNSKVYKSCLSATLDAYSGGFDYSNAAIGWQGNDFFNSEIRSNHKHWPAYLEYKAKGFKWENNALKGNGINELPKKQLLINGNTHFIGKAYYGKNVFLNH